MISSLVSSIHFKCPVGPNHRNRCPLVPLVAIPPPTTQHPWLPPAISQPCWHTPPKLLPILHPMSPRSLHVPYPASSHAPDIPNYPTTFFPISPHPLLISPMSSAKIPSSYIPPIPALLSPTIPPVFGSGKTNFVWVTAHSMINILSKKKQFKPTT